MLGCRGKRDAVAGFSDFLSFQATIICTKNFLFWSQTEAGVFLMSPEASFPVRVWTQLEVIETVCNVLLFCIKKHFIKHQLWDIWREGLSEAPKHKDVFQVYANSFFQNKQVIQQQFGLVVSQFMNNFKTPSNVPSCFCSDSNKARRWILRARTVERKASWGLFHLPAAKPRHTGQSTFKAWQWPQRDGRRQKCVGLWRGDHPQPPILYPSHPPKVMIHKLWLCNAPGSRDHSEKWGEGWSTLWLNQKCDCVTH